MEEEKDILTEENNESEIPVEAEMIDQAVEEAAEHAGGEDDGFFGKYIWDEETGRLYEITEDPKKKWDRLLPLLLLALPVTALGVWHRQGFLASAAGMLQRHLHTVRKQCGGTACPA